MRSYEVHITGTTALLMHWDNIDWADDMAEWQSNPANKKNSKAGDDRTPAWRWIGSAYNDGQHLCIPGDNLMRCMMEGGAMVPVPGGRGGKTFKAQTQSGLIISEPYWKLVIKNDLHNGLIPFSEIKYLLAENSFNEHKKAVEKLGFSLFVKRAKIGASKHIRVRPQFDNWSISGVVNVIDDQITEQVLSDILAYAGNYKGLGDWRPGSKTPGSFGMFKSTINLVKGGMK